MACSLRYRVQRAAFAARGLYPRRLRVVLERLHALLEPWLSRSREATTGDGEDHTAASRADSPAVVCLPVIDWELRLQRPQHLLCRLAARGYPVFYVRKDFGRSETLSPVRLAPGVTGISLPGPTDLSIYREVPTEQLVDRWCGALDHLRLRAGFAGAVVIVQWPFWAPLAERLRQRWGTKIVYDCLDEHLGYEHVSSSTLGLEEGLLRSSDLVVVTSLALLAKCRPLARRCEHLPNAGEFDRFSHAEKARSLSRLRRPVVGYYGALAEWFDVEMVAAAAEALPSWSFVVIGLNSSGRFGALERMPNVHLLGELPYRVLPRYLHAFDVATIPFKVTRLTRATNPLKLYEYLSAGKPVVASRLPEVEPLGPLVYLADTAEQFTAQLRRAAAEDDPSLRNARIAMARENTWDVRAERLDALIREL